MKKYCSILLAVLLAALNVGFARAEAPAVPFMNRRTKCCWKET